CSRYLAALGVEREPLFFTAIFGPRGGIDPRLEFSYCFAHYRGTTGGASQDTRFVHRLPMPGHFRLNRATAIAKDGPGWRDALPLPVMDGGGFRGMSAVER